MLWTLAAMFVPMLLAPASASALSLQEVGSFDTPTYVTSDPGDPNRLFVVEQAGVIRLTDRGGTRTFLDIADLVRSADDAGGHNEQGLFSMAFAPDYESSGLFYVFYTSADDLGTSEDETGDLHIAEFDSDQSLIESTRRVVLAIEHTTQGNHNGGQLQFGPDGYLYASTGDGGGVGDPDGNAQDTASLLGKILRIDPKGASAGDYTVPASNPFVGTSGADEVWSYGLRNPWRFSFDRLTGALTIGDVGQASFEEIDYDPGPDPGRGDNFGWNCREGKHAFSTAAPCGDSLALIDPVFQYPNPAGRCGSVTGGYVVRDIGLGDLFGRYLFADLCAGVLHSLILGLPTASGYQSEEVSVPYVTSFGEDADCRIYAVSGSGPVYRLTESATGEPAGCQQPAPAPAPSEPLTLELGARKQKLRKKLKFFATASDASTLIANSKAIKKKTKDLAANQKTKVKAKLKRRKKKKLANRLDKKGKAKVKVKATATTQSGADATDKVKVKLKD